MAGEQPADNDQILSLITAIELCGRLGDEVDQAAW